MDQIIIQTIIISKIIIIIDIINFLFLEKVYHLKLFTLLALCSVYYPLNFRIFLAFVIMLFHILTRQLHILISLIFLVILRKQVVDYDQLVE